LNINSNSWRYSNSTRCHWHRMHNNLFEHYIKWKAYAKLQCHAKNYKCMWCNWHRMHGECRAIDTACTIDERFERLWQPLKGISIKNIHVPELSYPASNQIYKFLGATDFGVRKSIISRRIWSRTKKGLSPWIRCPGDIVWPMVENLVTLFL
jgi:hypothetical protein